MSLSDRERAEGFHHTRTTAVVLIATAVAEGPPPQIVTLTPFTEQFWQPREWQTHSS